MKKSNILLVAGFLSIVGLVSAIHISLYAKYKAGDYTLYQEDEDLLADAMQTFPNIAFVSVRNVPEVTIRFSDVARVEKTENEDLQFTRKGDTLLISGGRNADINEIRDRLVYVPSTATMSITNSSVSIVPTKSPAEIKPVIYLKKSNVWFVGNSSPFQLGQVKIVATDTSSIGFYGNTQAASLDVQLTTSALDYREGDFEQLSIVTDSSSRISLLSKHLLKANIKTITPQ